MTDKSDAFLCARLTDHTKLQLHLLQQKLIPSRSLTLISKESSGGGLPKSFSWGFLAVFHSPPLHIIVIYSDLLLLHNCLYNSVL
jgi:hypothetical protein